jgi:hypothetical protein
MAKRQGAKVGANRKRRAHVVEETVAPADDDFGPEDFQEWARETWRNDKIWELPSGFTLIERGRDGAIYYRRGNAVVVFTWEFSGDPTLDIVIWEDIASIEWIDVHSLESSPVSPKERLAIKQELIDFLRARGASFRLDKQAYRAPARAARGSPAKPRQRSKQR